MLPDLDALGVPTGSTVVGSFVVGSHAHGTTIPPTDPHGTDDVDLMTIVVPPPALLLGIDTWEHATGWQGHHDVVVYSLQKLLRLLAKSNPNVLMLLHMPADCVMEASPVWDRLVEARDVFLTKEAWPAFSGYAFSQLQKMEGSAFQGYMGEKRKRLVQTFGYDTKNAAHLLRLLRMACDLFETGTLVVRRPDAEELRAVKRGERTLDSIRSEAATLFERGVAAMRRSSLPACVDRGAVGRLSADLHRQLLETQWTPS